MSGILFNGYRVNNTWAVVRVFVLHVFVFQHSSFQNAHQMISSWGKWWMIRKKLNMNVFRPKSKWLKNMLYVYRFQLRTYGIYYSKVAKLLCPVYMQSWLKEMCTFSKQSTWSLKQDKMKDISFWNLISRSIKKMKKKYFKMNSILLHFKRIHSITLCKS